LEHNIHFVEAKSLCAHVGLGNVIYESGQQLGDLRLSVVCFRNDAIVGNIVREPNIKAHIVYKDKNGAEITDVPRSVWLGQTGESTIFERGQRKCMIVLLLSNQGTLKKLWNESYTTAHSWMAGGPSFRIRDEAMSREVSSCEISLLTVKTCLLRAVFDVKQGEIGQLPNLVLNSISGS
jgi:hypothetical protein